VNKQVNPIIAYLKREEEHVIPDELFDTLMPVLKDKDVNDYLSEAVKDCLMRIRTQSPEAVSSGFRTVLLAAAAVGYMYGAEGNKTAAEVATDVLKELNIKEQEGK
jgi:hypothetical protein